MKELKEVLSKYARHPDFLGLELVDPNQRGAVDDAPLHIASRRGTPEDVRDLLALGARVNMPGDLGNTPLHFAALAGRADIVRTLLANGANPKMKNELGETPLQVAIQGAKAEVIALLK
jgi:ankyrin repeat protein